ncbi:MAG: ComF family protein [Gammaproteobacteria bacterium]
MQERGSSRYGNAMLHVIRNTLRRLCRCVICENPATWHNLCAQCHRDLPVAHSACQRCALPLPEPDARCGACLLHTPVWDNAASAFDYRFPVDLLVTRTKFNGRLDMARALGHASAHQFQIAHPVNADAILPIPLHWRRRWQRGFNQAAVLAEPVADYLNIPFRCDLLQRKRSTPEQTRLDGEARRENLDGAFAVTGDVTHQNLILFDDVMTTGATLGAATTALKTSGANTVRVWTCARVATGNRQTN